SASTNATSMSLGSLRYPSLQSRHMDDSAGGKPWSSVLSSAAGSCSSREDVEAHLLFAFLGLAGGKSLGLQTEHRPVAAVVGHELVVAAELDDRTALDDADPIGVAHRREAVGDE